MLNVQAMEKGSMPVGQRMVSGVAHPLFFSSVLYAGIVVFFQQVSIIVDAGWKLDHPHYTFLPEKDVSC